VENHTLLLPVLAPALVRAPVRVRAPELELELVLVPSPVLELAPVPVPLLVLVHRRWEGGRKQSAVAVAEGGVREDVESCM